MSEFYEEEPLSDEEQEEATVEKRKIAREQELEDIKTLCKSPWGKRFFVRLMADAKVFSTTFSTDHSQSSFLEGHRNLALRYFHDVVEVAPEIIPYLMVEGGKTS